MPSLRLQSAVMLGLAGAAFAAPAANVLRLRQEFGVVSNTTVSTSSASTSATASATVSGITEPTDVSGGTDTDLSKEDFCDEAGLNDLDTVISIWNDRGIGQYLDDFLSNDDYANEDDWVVKMATAAFKGTGTSGGWTCGEMDLTCFKTTDLNCYEMFDRGFGYEYWIFKAVQNLQNNMESANRNLGTSTTSDLINIPIINDEFAVELKDTNGLLKFIGAAFGMAGGLVAFGRFSDNAAKLFRDDAKASASLFGGSFAASAAQSPPSPPDASVDMYEALKKIFDGQLSDVEKWLSLGTGGDGDKNELPDRGLVNGETPRSAISGFFAQGRWILENDDSAEYFKQAYAFTEQKMVDVALSTFGYKILADHNQEDEGMCSEQPYAFWMNVPDVGDRCMRLVYKNGGDSNEYPPASEDVLKKVEEHGLDIKHYFDVTMDCALNGGDDAMVDLENIPFDAEGSPPRCFFNLPFMDAEIWLAGDNPDDDDDWVIGWPISFKEVASWNN